MIVAPPVIVGTDAIAETYGVSRWWVRDRVRNQDPQYLHGYIGKIGGRHAWNISETLNSFMAPEMIEEQARFTERCAVPDCDASCGPIGLCLFHLSWLVGMCQCIETRFRGSLNITW